MSKCGIYNIVSTNALLKFIYSRTFKISNLKTKAPFNKVYIGGQWDQLVVAVAEEPKMQSCRKAKMVICSQGGPWFYKVQRPGCEGQAQTTAGHTLHASGESTVLTDKDSKLQPFSSLRYKLKRIHILHFGMHAHASYIIFIFSN